MSENRCRLVENLHKKAGYESILSGLKARLPDGYDNDPESRRNICIPPQFYDNITVKFKYIIRRTNQNSF